MSIEEILREQAQDQLFQEIRERIEQGREKGSIEDTVTGLIMHNPLQLIFIFFKISN